MSKGGKEKDLGLPIPPHGGKWTDHWANCVDMLLTNQFFGTEKQCHGETCYLPSSWLEAVKRMDEEAMNSNPSLKPKYPNRRALMTLIMAGKSTRTVPTEFENFRNDDDTYPFATLKEYVRSDRIRSICMAIKVATCRPSCWNEVDSFASWWTALGQSLIGVDNNVSSATIDWSKAPRWVEQWVTRHATIVQLTHARWETLFPWSNHGFWQALVSYETHPAAVSTTIARLQLITCDDPPQRWSLVLDERSSFLVSSLKIFLCSSIRVVENYLLKNTEIFVYCIRR